MKISIHRPVLALALAAVLMSWSGASAADETSYPMTCRGGGAMEARLLDAPTSMMPLRGFQIQFSRSPDPASRRPPGPGECAWLDRPIRADEPAVLIFRTVESTESAFDVVVRQGSIQLEPAAKTPDLRYLISEIHNGRIFHVHCHQYRGRGPGFFVITRTGP